MDPNRRGELATQYVLHLIERGPPKLDKNMRRRAGQLAQQIKISTDEATSFAWTIMVMLMEQSFGRRLNRTDLMEPTRLGEISLLFLKNWAKKKGYTEGNSKFTRALRQASSELRIDPGEAFTFAVDFFFS